MQEIKVRFTQQQLVLLQQMKTETGDDRDMRETILAMFRDHARQMLGREFRE